MNTNQEKTGAELEELRKELAELEETYEKYGIHHGPTGYGIPPVPPLTYERRERR